MVIKAVERDEMMTLAENLGNADLVEEASLGDVKILKVIAIKDMGTTTSVLVRGSDQLLLYEAEGNLHDDLCVVMCMVSKRFLTSGDGAPEIELSRQLGAWAKILHGMEGFCVKFFAEALWLFPYTLAGNAELSRNKE
ncbi:T-complex protein 1 subunit delta [Brassica rapa]|uniref:T-complex protein 1 subunit delta n=1 Tax=Brassica campestris TaxID=3711 RepID=UPI00142D3DB0|nr:T-complex protein 1 subunit delta [Brassica rapa]